MYGSQQKKDAEQTYICFCKRYLQQKFWFIDKTWYSGFPIRLVLHIDDILYEGGPISL